MRTREVQRERKELIKGSFHHSPQEDWRMERKQKPKFVRNSFSETDITLSCDYYRFMCKPPGLSFQHISSHLLVTIP